MTGTEKPITIPVTQRNVIIISGFVKQNVVSVSYNGNFRTMKLDDKVLREIVYGINFEDNYFKFMGATVPMLKSLTKK